MRIVDIREQIRLVRDQWNSLYGHNAPGARFPGSSGVTVGEIHAALARLDLETCSVADVDAAIGRPGWIELRCDECGEQQERVVRIGDEPDYEARWQELCGECLGKALALLASPPPSR